jgi:hypothetical protein
VRKLLIGSMIVLLMIFTAGLASAAQSTFPFITTTGTLYFVSDSGVVTSDSTTPPTITIDQATVTTGEPSNLFYGTFKMNPTASATLPGTALTINFAATMGDDNLFRITGTNGAGIFVVATGRLFAKWAHTSNTSYEKEHPHESPQSIELTGSILEGATTTSAAPAVTYHFEGILSE